MIRKFPVPSSDGRWIEPEIGPTPNDDVPTPGAGIANAPDPGATIIIAGLVVVVVTTIAGLVVVVVVTTVAGLVVVVAGLVVVVAGLVVVVAGLAVVVAGLVVVVAGGVGPSLGGGEVEDGPTMVDVVPVVGTAVDWSEFAELDTTAGNTAANGDATAIGSSAGGSMAPPPPTDVDSGGRVASVRASPAPDTSVGEVGADAMSAGNTGADLVTRWLST